jgi:glycine/D-amino acid oxidase-like deaminating enzyme
MDTNIKKILVVGGGTAGWLSACYLNRALQDKVEITLIESSAVPRVGVGEATVQTLRATLAFIGLTDADWMPKVGGTYKSAIKFENWVDPKPGTKNHYWHPFVKHPGPSIQPFGAPYFPEIGTEVALTHYAHHLRLQGEPRSIAELLLPTPALCEANKSPVNPGDHSLDVATAFHLDAGRLAGFLSELGRSRGIKHVVDHLVDVGVDERGFISHVTTESGLRLDADLFLDCTGFQGLLINQALGVEFCDQSKHLLCDSAVALSATQAAEADGIKPYTTASALRHGWAWDIPLRHRRGCGYVYSSAFSTRDEAEREIREFLGDAASESSANHIKIRVGVNEEPWRNNCVAIGLSGSFIEPLESTGIFLVEYALALLLTLFPDKRFDPGRIRRFNEGFRQMYDETRDFIVLHYYVNRRTDTKFWEAARAESVMTDSLAQKLEFLRHGLPVLDKLKLTNFRSFAYTCILDGCGQLPEQPAPIVRLVGQDLARAEFERIEALTRETVAAMPSHVDALGMMDSAAGLD